MLFEEIMSYLITLRYAISVNHSGKIKVCAQPSAVSYMCSVHLSDREAPKLVCGLGFNLCTQERETDVWMFLLWNLIIAQGLQWFSHKKIDWWFDSVSPELNLKKQERTQRCGGENKIRQRWEVSHDKAQVWWFVVASFFLSLSCDAPQMCIEFEILIIYWS